ncbi:MAG: hypothetical protein R6X31_00800 [Anaerolineae bacterium]
MAVDASLGRASIAIRATLDKLDKDLAGAREKTESAISGITKSAGQSFQNLGKVALGGVAAGGAAVAGLGVGFGKIITDSTMAASSVSELRSTLGVLGKRAGWTEGEIDTNVQTMKDLGITSDVAMKTLNEFARQQLNVEDATMAARAAQDLAVLSQRDSSETLDELIYGIKTQNSGLQVFRDLGIQAGSVLDDYAESLGKSKDELTETERQQAMLNAVQDEATKIQGLYTNAMEEPGKAMRSFPRYFQEIRESIGAHFQDALGNVVFGLKDVVGGIQGLLEEGEPLSRIFGALGDIASTVTESLFGMAGGGEGLYQALEGIASIVETLAEKIGAFFGLIEIGYEPLDALQVVLRSLGMEGLAVVVEKIRDFLAAASEVLGPVLAWIGENVKLQDVLVGLGAAIASVIIPILATVISAIAPVIAVFLVVVAAVAALRKAWESNFLGIRDVTNVVINLVRGFIENVLIPAVENIYDAWVNVTWPAIQKAIEVAWDVIEPIWEKLREWLEDTLPPVIEGLGNAFDTAMGAIDKAVTPIKDLWDKFVDAVQGFWDWISGKTFKFKLNLPKLPDWALPGSPLPIHTAWKEFAREINHMSLNAPQMMGIMREQTDRVSVMTAERHAVAPAAAAGLGGGRPAGNTWTGNLIIEGAHDPHETASAVIRALQDRGMLPSTLLR